MFLGFGGHGGMLSLIHSEATNSISTLCLKKNDTGMHIITSTHINRFWKFLAAMLLNECVI